jgi:FAD:protein FMN transferase
METMFMYEVMGTVWKVIIYKEINDDAKTSLENELKERLASFDSLYSRFREDSLVSRIAQNQGIYEVPHDLTNILSIYKEVYELSHKKFTPCIGTLLEDVGYDKEYTLRQKETLRDVVDFGRVRILDDTHIEVQEKILLDIGAIGKGYCVDLITRYIKSLGYIHFLVDGSGDIFYEGVTSPIRVGLEHPGDTSKVIGVIEMNRGAMCSSAINRRVWGKYSHYVDPDNKTSPDTIIATWVIADTAAYADAISSLLFFVSPEEVKKGLPHVSFSFCIMNHEHKIKKSSDFAATFF